MPRTNIKANVELTHCHQEFWELMYFFQSLGEVDVPKGKFSLVSEKESLIVEALKEAFSGESVASIIRGILCCPRCEPNSKVSRASQAPGEIGRVRGGP